MDTIDSFGAWVRRRRRVVRLTQAELAGAVGCSVVLVRKIEADERRPSAELARRLAQHLGLPHQIHQLFAQVARANVAARHLPPPDRIAATDRTAPPAPTEPIIGRRAELAHAGDLARHHLARLVTLVGPPGIGKTRLAHEVCRELLPDHPGGAWFVDLSPVRDPAFVMPMVVAALGLQDRAGDPLKVATAFLSPRRALLALDNLEQVVEAAPQIAALLEGAPGLCVLATSRTPLRLRGERLIAVPPLSPADGAALFLRRARAFAPGYAGAPDDRERVAQIVALTDGLPLAIELAAARARRLSPDGLLAGLAVGRSLLARETDAGPARHRTLQQAFLWSYDLLPAAEQQLLRTLGVFAGGFTFEAAAEVARDAAGWENPETLLDALADLLDHSLIVREGERFAMLESLREFAAEQLAEAGELGAAQRAHAAWALRFAERAEAAEHSPQERALFDELEQERGNIRAALAWVCEAGHPDIAARLGRALVAFWQRRGSQREGTSWLRRITAVRGQSPRLRAQLLGRVMWLTNMRDDMDWAERCAEEGLAIYTALGDELGRALLIGALGNFAERRGEYTVALDYYRQCEAIYSVRGTQRHRAMVSYWIGETLYLLGDLAGAEQELAESLRHGRAIGSLLIVTRRLALLALVHLESGGGEQVADMLRESIALSIQLDNRLELGILLIGCARLALHRGGHRRAATLLGAAEERFAAIDLEPDDVCARARRITLDALAETLSEAEAADALRQGRGLTLAQALALAGADLGPIG